MKLIVRFLACGFLVSTALISQGLETLSEAQMLAHMLPEYPEVDNDNLLKPDYSTFYRSRVPSRFQRFKEFLGFEKSLWHPQDCINLLADLAQERENTGHLGRFIEKIVPKSGERYFVFSDLHGGFHSFVRMLTQMEHEGLLDKTWTLRNKIFFVFNGNVIDVGPYPLETLTLVARLLKKNPKTVFYVRGMHEDKGYWYDDVLRDQLEILAGYLSSEKIPFNSIITRFFNTLPLALYLMSYDKKTPEAVKIISLQDPEKEINEEMVNDFFSERYDKFPDIYKLDLKQKSTSTVLIRAIIRPDNRGLLYVPTRGLRKDESLEGATVWSTLTTPLMTNRVLYSFFVDAYAVISIFDKMSEWTISLYNHDVREPGFIRQSREYDLLSGDELIDGKKVVIIQSQQASLQQQKQQFAEKDLPDRVQQAAQKDASDDQKELVIGATLDLSGVRKSGSTAMKLGINLAFDEANQHGGIQGKNIRLVALDDASDPIKAKQNVEKLGATYGTSIIFAPFGYESLSGFMDLVKDEKIAVMFPNTGASKAHDPGLKNMIHFRSSYQDIDTALIRYAERTFKPKKMAFVYSSGESAFGIDKHIKEAQLKVEYKEFTHSEDEVDFTALIKQLKEYNPDVIGAFSYAAEEFVRQLDVDFLVGKIILLTESEENLRKFLVDRGIIDQVVISQNLPNPYESQLPLVKDYTKAMGTRTYDINSFYGYIVGKLFVKILRDIEGPITKDSVLEKARNIKDFDFGGFKLDFVLSRQQLYHDLWLDQGSSQWKELNLRKEIGY